MSRIFGIDLGTTHSLIAVTEDGGPRVFADPERGALLPSVVALLDDGRTCVGAPAVELEAGGEVNGVVIRSVKRYMGLGEADLAPEDRRRYSFAGTGSSVVAFKAGNRTVTPPEVSAKILAELKRRAETVLGGEQVEQVVITVPAYFNDGQRQATRDAGRLAGLEVVRLLNEPTAASLAYGLQKLTEGRLAVYDLGGGTFDISILNIKGGVFEVLATNGDTHLGGDDIDRAIVDWLLADVPREAVGDRRIWNRARTACEAAKRVLSDAEVTEVRLELGDRVIVKPLTRTELELMAAPLVERTLDCCRRALEDAGVRDTPLDAVVLVGGATRMPLVRRKTAVFFGREPLCSRE